MRVLARWVLTLGGLTLGHGRRMQQRHGRPVQPFQGGFHKSFQFGPNPEDKIRFGKLAGSRRPQ